MHTHSWTHGDKDFWYNLKKSILRVFFQNLQVQLNHCSELPTFKETKNDFGCLPNIFVLTETVLYFLETKRNKTSTLEEKIKIYFLRKKSRRRKLFLYF